ncbi:hypothetical protein SDC9_146879 [bioreactor metagenome]|uniref:Uncharacterized protein n=1 Tax=bioreactor metagenome TaxID=1076179 RepID=A0A645EE42_9ZZZZ
MSSPATAPTKFWPSVFRLSSTRKKPFFFPILLTASIRSMPTISASNGGRLRWTITLIFQRRSFSAAKAALFSRIQTRPPEKRWIQGKSGGFWTLTPTSWYWWTRLTWTSAAARSFHSFLAIPTLWWYGPFQNPERSPGCGRATPWGVPI